MQLCFTVVFLVSSFTGSQCPRPVPPNETSPYEHKPSLTSFEMSEFHVNECETRYFENYTDFASKELPPRRSTARSADEELKFRLTDAQKVNIEEVPYTVAYGYGCSGTIIHSWWVITCAHCGSWDAFVYAGSSFFFKSNVFGVCAHYVHPKYQSKFNEHEDDYDLQLLLMDGPFPKEPAFAPIPIANMDTNDIDPASIITLSGWGRTGEAIETVMEDSLRKLEVPLMSDTRCRTYSRLSEYYEPTERMFCAGYATCCGKGACDGDSGGPAVLDGELYGIIALGAGCGDELPTILTKVNEREIRSWIRFTTKIAL